MRTYSRRLIAEAIGEPGIGPARAGELLEAIRSDLTGMQTFLHSPDGQGADEAAWLKAFPGIPEITGVDRTSVARAVMRVVARLSDGIVVEG